MSTFGTINTAYTGLVAARAAMDVAGQNVANVNTAGYTRQRVDQSSIDGVASPGGVHVTGVNIGGGTVVQGITRMNDALVDARVRDTAASSGYWDVVSGAASDVETGLGEPGTSGVSATLSDFWAAWQELGNTAGSSTSRGASGAALLEQGRLVASRLASGYTAAANAWSASRSTAAATVGSINDAAAQVASLNTAIIAGRATGGSVNELIDQRATALTTLSRLAGATTRDTGNGGVDVVVDGNALVSGSASRRLAITGATELANAGTDPVRVVWADRPAVAANPAGGELAGRLATLAGPASDGTGGVYAEAAKVYDDLATTIANQVNALHDAGSTPSGTSPAGPFFSLPATGSAALGLRVVPTTADQIATGAPGKGGSDASVADAIAQLGTADTSPDHAWATFVSRLGSAARVSGTQATIAGQASTAATTAQTSQSGVDLDEETSNLVVFQHAYQGAARVMTAIDEMLDTLINKTGLVGR